MLCDLRSYNRFDCVRKCTECAAYIKQPFYKKIGTNLFGRKCALDACEIVDGVKQVWCPASGGSCMSMAAGVDGCSKCMTGAKLRAIGGSRFCSVPCRLDLEFEGAKRISRECSEVSPGQKCKVKCKPGWFPIHPDLEPFFQCPNPNRKRDWKKNDVGFPLLPQCTEGKCKKGSMQVEGMRISHRELAHGTSTFQPCPLGGVVFVCHKGKLTTSNSCRRSCSEKTVNDGPHVMGLGGEEHSRDVFRAFVQNPQPWS